MGSFITLLRINQLCPEKYLPIVEATIDGAIKMDELADRLNQFRRMPQKCRLQKKALETLHRL